MTNLSELRERLEKAEGPDCILGMDIRYALLGECPHRRQDWFTATDSDGEEYSVRQCTDCGKKHPAKRIGTDPTASLDAAIALVEAKLPGWGKNSQQTGRGFYVYVFDIGHPARYHRGFHKSEPIALLLALLSALEKESAE